MTSASHAERSRVRVSPRYFFCQFVKLHAQGTLVPYREVRRARVYLRHENSPLVHRGASTAYRGREAAAVGPPRVRGSLVVGAAASARAAACDFSSWASRAVGFRETSERKARRRAPLRFFFQLAAVADVSARVGRELVMTSASHAFLSCGFSMVFVSWLASLGSVFFANLGLESGDLARLRLRPAASLGTIPRGPTGPRLLALREQPARPPGRVDGVSRARKPFAVGPRGPRLARRRRGLGPGPRRGKMQPCPWGVEASRCPLRKPKGLPP